MSRFFSLILSALLMAALVGCGPIYRTDYNYMPPKSSAGKMCISQCLQNKSICEQSCQVSNENCKERAHEDALLQYATYRADQARNNQPIKKSVNDFDTSYRCNQSCDCAPAFNSCYSACGGQIQTNKVCVAFCDKQ